jgi:hemerythrin
MALIEWTDQLLVHVAQIDEQHRRLIRIINDLNESMKARKGKGELGSAIESLVEYTEFHFTTEERLMTANGYISTTVHRAEHRAFVAKTQEFAEGFKSGKLLLSMDVMNFLRVWLTQHICKVDKELAAFLREKGLT